MILGLMGLSGKVKTLLGRLTATRAGYLDNLDAAVTTRAAASTALTNVTWTDAKAGYLDAAITGRLGSIKTIQQGAVNIITGSTTGTSTLSTSVTTSKSIVFFQGCYPNGTNLTTLQEIAAIFAQVSLTNTNTVTATRAGGGANILVGYVVVEFN